MPISLRPITRRNVRAICELRLAESQRDLVAPAAFTIAEGHYEPGALLRAIYLDEQAAGVLLIEVDSGTPYLVRFMIDERLQRRGIGREAVALVVEELRGGGWTKVETSFVPGEHGPGVFWLGCGFADTGRITDGEPIFARVVD